MPAATKVKKSGGEKKVNRTTYNISSMKRVTGKFLEVSRCRRAKQQQRNVQESLLHLQSWFFAVFVAVASWLTLHDFIFCFSNYRY